MPYGLTESELGRLRELFTSNERIMEVVLYGSRAKGTFKPFSDVDITLVGTRLSRQDLNRLALAIDDLLLPYQFDISLFHSLRNAALTDHILRRGQSIYKREPA